MYLQLPKIARYTKIYPNNILITLIFYFNSTSLSKSPPQPTPLRVDNDNRKEEALNKFSRIA